MMKKRESSIFSYLMLTKLLQSVRDDRIHIPRNLHIKIEGNDEK